jgi:hypothetical protein
MSTTYIGGYPIVTPVHGPPYLTAATVLRLLDDIATDADRHGFSGLLLDAIDTLEPIVTSQKQEQA